jgi:glycogen synthase
MHWSSSRPARRARGMGTEMRRVLMTGDAVGGVWTYAIELTRALGAHGVRVTLATMGPHPSVDQLAIAATLPNLEIAVGGFELEWMHDPWIGVDAAGGWLLELDRNIRPDVVHLNGYAHAALPWSAPAVVAGHSCLLSWADAVPGVLDERQLAAYRVRVTLGIQAADLVAAPSAAMLAALDRHYAPLPPSRVIPNGRSGEPFRAARKEPFVLSAGRLWDRAKNVEALAAIAARLPWPVAVAGATSAGNDPQASTSTLPNVRYLGQLSEDHLASWLARAAIFALPARYEPFGMLPLEAGLSGCALVLGDTPSLREVWGDAADYVDPEDPDALRRAIIRLTSSASLIQARARAAYDRAARYTPERMADGYLDAYRDAARRHSRCAS